MRVTQCQDGIMVNLKGLFWVSLLHLFMIYVVRGNCAVDEKGFFSAVGMGELIKLYLPPPPYEDRSLKGQTTELVEVVQEGMIRVPAQREGHNITEATQTQNAAFRRIATGNIIDVQDFLVCNIIASLCFIPPIGLLGVEFSILCRSAKLKGKRKQAKCFSVVEGVMFSLSAVAYVILVILLIIVFLG